MKEDAIAARCLVVLINSSPTGEATPVTSASRPMLASTGTTVSNTELIPFRVLHERPPVEFLPD
jgi:hypothetical protein